MTGSYPPTSEMGPWADVLTPVQRAVWKAFIDARVSDWPGDSFEEIKAIGVSWGLGICTDLLFEAIACWVHHHVQNRQVPPYLADWLGNQPQKPAGNEEEHR